MSKDWASKAGKFVQQLSDKAVEVTSAAKEEFDKSELKTRAATAAQATKQFLDEKGVTEKVVKVSDVIGDNLDTVAGVKQLQLVEERLELQAQYNDILAEKLEEALGRIEALEQQLAILKKSG